jgi:hypothetical protein
MCGRPARPVTSGRSQHVSQHVETVHPVGLIEHPGFGYMMKDCLLEDGELLETCERVAAGGSSLDPKVVSHLVVGRSDT